MASGSEGIVPPAVNCPGGFQQFVARWQRSDGTRRDSAVKQIEELQNELRLIDARQAQVPKIKEQLETVFSGATTYDFDGRYLIVRIDTDVTTHSADRLQDAQDDHTALASAQLDSSNDRAHGTDSLRVRTLPTKPKELPESRATFSRPNVAIPAFLLKTVHTGESLVAQMKDGSWKALRCPECDATRRLANGRVIDTINGLRAHIAKAHRHQYELKMKAISGVAFLEHCAYRSLTAEELALVQSEPEAVSTTSAAVSAEQRDGRTRDSAIDLMDVGRSHTAEGDSIELPHEGPGSHCEATTQHDSSDLPAMPDLAPQSEIKNEGAHLDGSAEDVEMISEEGMLCETSDDESDGANASSPRLSDSDEEWQPEE